MVFHKQDVQYYDNIYCNVYMDSKCIPIFEHACRYIKLSRVNCFGSIISKLIEDWRVWYNSELVSYYV